MKTKSIIWLLICGFLVLGCQQESTSTSSLNSGTAADLGGPISVSGDLSTDWVGGTDRQLTPAEELAYLNALLRISATISDDIKLVIALKLRLIFSEQGAQLPADFDLEKWISEAYITIRNFGGAPVAVIVGKHRIAFGQNISEMPMFEHNSPLYNMTRYDEVIGFTVMLQNVPFFDLVEISKFETGRGDLDIGEINGSAVRLTKQLTEKIKSEISYMSRDSDRTVSLGFVFDDGHWTVWSEGVYRENSDYGLTIGAAHKLGPGRVMIEGSYLKDSLRQLGIGYELSLQDNVTIGPEVRYTEYDNGEGAWSLGVRTRIIFRST